MYPLDHTPIQGKNDLYSYKDKCHFYSQPGKLSEILHDCSFINYNWKDNKPEFDSIVTRKYLNSKKATGFRCICEGNK